MPVEVAEVARHNRQPMDESRRKDLGVQFAFWQALPELLSPDAAVALYDGPIDGQDATTDQPRQVALEPDLQFCPAFSRLLPLDAEP